MSKVCFNFISQTHLILDIVLVMFLMTHKVKGCTVYCSSLFVEVSVNNHLAPMQDGMTEGITEQTVGNRNSSIKRWQQPLSVPYISFRLSVLRVHSTHTRVRYSKSQHYLRFSHLQKSQPVTIWDFGETYSYNL